MTNYALINLQLKLTSSEKDELKKSAQMNNFVASVITHGYAVIITKESEATLVIDPFLEYQKYSAGHSRIKNSGAAKKINKNCQFDIVDISRNSRKHLPVYFVVKDHSNLHPIG